MARRRVDRAVVTVAVALAGMGVVMAAGWGAQMVGLPKATATDRLVASAEGWLRDNPLAIDTFRRTSAPAVDGICLRTSVRAFTRSRLGLTQGPLFAVSPRHAHRVSGTKLPGFPARLASRIGCTTMLLQPVMSAAVARVHVPAADSVAAGEPAIALTFPPYRGQRLVLYVSPKSGRPILAEERVGRVMLTATLHLEQPAPAQLARLRRKLQLRAEPRR